MNSKPVLCAFALATGLIFSASTIAQVPVRLEPRHHNILENRWLRILDVWLPPGDTTKFHIHATPSLFVMFSAVQIGAQEMGSNWTKELSKAGNAWYRSFIGDTLVHRVANLDSHPFHVNDIEILSGFDRAHPKKALPFPVLFENEQAFAYRIPNQDLNKIKIQDRGPMVIALVAGAGLFYHDEKLKKINAIQPGTCLYMAPGTSFSFKMDGNAELNLVVFELK